MAVAAAQNGKISLFPSTKILTDSDSTITPSLSNSSSPHKSHSASPLQNGLIAHKNGFRSHSHSQSPRSHIAHSSKHSLSQNIKCFLCTAVLITMALLSWSMIHYSPIIGAQLWSPIHETMDPVDYRSDIAEQLNLHGLRPPDSDRNSHSDSHFDVDHDPHLDDDVGVGDAVSSTRSTLQNVSYLIPPFRLNASDHSLTAYFSKSVVFLGMISNAEDTLPHILEQLDAVSCIFRNSLFLFFESNSVDNTTLILESWRQNTSFDSFCDNVMDRNLASNHPVHSVQKQVIYGDDIVRSELNSEIKKRSNSTYVHSLSRVEKFVAFRNMLLREVRVRVRSTSISFDYLWMIDGDVFSIDFKSFLVELLECPTDIMCINGVDPFNDYRDSFATVEMSHNWIHRPFIFNKSDSYYDRARNILRKKMPRKQVRYELVRSCFNGLASYPMHSVLDTQCAYYSNDDILLMKSRLSAQDGEGEGQPVSEWVNHVTKLINWSNLKGVMFDNDSGFETNLCEHIAFHYCLYGMDGLSLSIAKNTKLYYYPLAPPPNKEDRRARRRRRRREQRRKKRESLAQKQHLQIQ